MIRINLKNELPVDLQCNYLNVFFDLLFDKMVINHRISDYIIKSFELNVDNEIIRQQKEKIEKLYFALESISKIDHLTSVLNKKAFYESLETEKKRTLRDLWKIKEIRSEFISEESSQEKKVNPEDYFGSFTCLMIDIDHFKKINDTYGHLSGDEVLRKIGEVLTSKQIFRDTDIIGRFGGEEFIIILPDTTTESALIPAE
jgi:PleD family two-component response regulator